MRFTKDSEWKHETAKGHSKTAETALPKKQSESARDWGRVHGLTSFKDLICSIRILPERREEFCWKEQIFYMSIVRVIPENVAEIDAKFMTSDPSTERGGIWILTKYCRSWKPSQALSSLCTHPQSPKITIGMTYLLSLQIWNFDRPLFNL